MIDNRSFSVSRKLNINPDNVATPIAASLGDLVTLAILAQSAKVIHNFSKYPSYIFMPELVYPFAILVVYALIVVPFSLKLAKTCNSTSVLLTNGWTPVLSAMVISSLGGTILNKTIKSFPKIGKGENYTMASAMSS